MAIIQKRADELRIGDVLPPHQAWPRRVVYHVYATDATVCPHTYPTGAAFQQPPMAPEVYDRAATVDVEVPDPIISPGDLDVLLDAADVYCGSSATPAPSVDVVRALVDRLRPPAPPTLAEALEQLQAVHDAKFPGDELGRIWNFLDRARRSGLLK